MLELLEADTVAETNVTPDGRTSVTVTLSAEEGPWFERLT
jgi:hypothetical protein